MPSWWTTKRFRKNYEQKSSWRSKSSNEL